MDYSNIKCNEILGLHEAYMTKEELNQLSTNKNIAYYKYLANNKVYIKLVGHYEYIIINIEEEKEC